MDKKYMIRLLIATMFFSLNATQESIAMEEHSELSENFKQSPWETFQKELIDEIQTNWTSSKAKNPRNQEYSLKTPTHDWCGTYTCDALIVTGNKILEYFNAKGKVDANFIFRKTKMGYTDNIYDIICKNKKPEWSIELNADNTDEEAGDYCASLYLCGERIIVFRLKIDK